ncbi:unnamed protein product [Clonostachys rhizophaga]|uniref:Major facilitator superfamily (MFS) profile domain-containing protein n=1 Tax=Clonostachys rhizophaga TaxID=160324 RepID=A0A9N9YGT0_9HYPO|nr:unnamed protein product [Clonostachys rhizophaga]
MTAKPKSNSNGASHEEATERTPLFRNLPSDGEDSENDGDQPVKKPLDKVQMFLLCYARMMEPIAYFAIFPFIAEMVERNGKLPESDIGFYSGLIESLFSAIQMFVLIFWGRLSDIVGRKPILIYSMVGMSITPVLFCMSTTIWQMIMFRCIAGVFSGSNLVIRTMVSENSTSETQARAFSWFAFGGNIGLVLGPILGGIFANPVKQYPNIFEGIEFFEKYPYALPGIITGGICATGVIACSLYLKETLVKEKATVISSSGELVQQPEPLMSMTEIIRSPGVTFVLWLYTHVMLLAFLFTAILPVALYTSVELGGIGFDTHQITVWMAVQGVSQATWLVLAFPLLHKRFGNKGVLNLCSTMYPIFFALFILLNVLLRNGSPSATTWFWILAALSSTVGPGVSMAFTGVQLALNDVAPGPRVLGTLNAIALTAASALRAVAPGVATVVYALGVRNQILGGQLAWVILIPIACVFTVGSRWLPDSKRPQSSSDSTEDEDA